MQGSFINKSYSNTTNSNQYIVKPGDSLYSIAKAYNTTVEELKKHNNLISNMIYPNQILFIPRKSECLTENVNDNKTYVTLPSETLKDIMNKYNICLNDLEEYNDLDKLKLEGNQMLLIRKKEEKKYHVVEENEGLEDILSKYQLSPYELLKLNEDIIIYTGNKIIIEK